jgi:hypothetical protein
MASERFCRSDRLHYGKVNNKVACADVTLHVCGSRIKTFKVEYVLGGEAAVVISTPYEILHSAMLAEDKSLHAKMSTLLAHGRALCIDNVVVNIDGVYVPELLQCLEYGAGVVPVTSLPTHKDAVEKGVHPVVAAMIVAAPSTPAPWAYHAHNGVLYCKNVQVCVEPGVGHVTVGKFLLTGHVKFERSRNVVLEAPVVPPVALPAAVLPVVPPVVPPVLPPVGHLGGIEAAPPVQQVMELGTDATRRQLTSHAADDIASFMRLLQVMADGIAAFKSPRV